MSARGRRALAFAVASVLGVATIVEALENVPRDTTGVIRGSVRVGRILTPYANVITLEGKRGVLTDEQGEFVIEDLPPGRYTLRTQVVGAPRVEYSVHVAAGDTTRVRIKVPDPKDPRVIARHTPKLDDEALRRIRVSTSARVFLIEEQDLSHPEPDSAFAPFHIARELAPPDTSFIRDITRLLGDPKSFRRRPDYEKKMCSFNPRVGLSFASPKGEAHALICLTCLEVVVRRDQRGQKLDFEPVASEVREWVTRNVGPVEQRDVGR